MTVTAPPRPPRPSDPVDREELEALVEALIEEARKRAQRRRRRNVAIVTLVALVGVAVFAVFGRSAQSQTASPALAGGSSLSHASKQRVEITATGMANPSSSLKFVLTPVQTGETGGFKPDSGTETSVIRNQRDVVREGQSAQIVTWITTAKGKLGSFVLRVRIEHVDAGNGFHIGTGTWTFVRGTGEYADATGGGRVANAWVETNGRLGRISERRTGFLTVR